MTGKTLITDALLRLGDSYSDRWSRAEMLNYLNWGLKEYARRTRSFRKIEQLATGQWPERFELPKDTVEVYFCEYDNSVIDASSWRELEELDPKFTTKTGTPERWYQDITDITQLRLYPIPTNNEEDLATIEQQNNNPLSTPVDATGTRDTGAVVYATFDGSDATIEYSNPSGDAAAPTDGSVLAADQLGAVVWIEDTAGTRTFEIAKSQDKMFSSQRYEGEQGSIHSMAASKVRIGYAYVPPEMGDENTEFVIPDHLEEGLIHFLMVRAYEKDGETRDLEKAKYFRQMFEQVVFEAQRRANEGFMQRARKVEGYWL
jgi:hypothetical protein